MPVGVGGVVHLSTGKKGHMTWCSGRIGICLTLVLRCPGQWEEACLSDVTSSQQTGCQWESPHLSRERWHQDGIDIFNI